MVLFMKRDEFRKNGEWISKWSWTVGFYRIIKTKCMLGDCRGSRANSSYHWSRASWVLAPGCISPLLHFWTLPATSQPNRPRLIYKELSWRKRLNIQLVILLGKIGPLFICIRFCWRNIGGRAWMSLAASHLHTARSRASFPRMFEHFIHRVSTLSTVFLKLQSVSAHRAVWKPDKRVVYLLLRVVTEKVAAPGSVLAFSQKCLLPGQQLCPCVHS